MLFRSLDQAAAVLTETHAPLEYGRVLNAAAAQHRALGDAARSLELFERAAALLEVRSGAEEAAAAWSNVGLARCDHGNAAEAVKAFDRALAVLGDHREARIVATVLVNRGLAHFALGDFASARADLTSGLALDGPDTAPVQVGLAHHSLGQLAVGEGQPAVAIASFEAALRIFTHNAFPGQHAIALFNLGVAHAAVGGLGGLRRAHWNLEAAANRFDPRVHAAHWQEVARRLGEVVEQLAVLEPDTTVAQHRATLLASTDEPERLAMTRVLFERFAARPDPQRRDAFADAAHAACSIGSARALLETALFALAELPDDVLRSGLAGQLEAHGRLDGDAVLTADLLIDQVIQHLFQGPQRVRFRDVLYALGWERP